MKFSIIIPCYNEESNLQQLIKSILPLQKKYNLEYILVENGSVDNSKDVFRREVENQYDNISIVYIKKNIGYGYGIQQGIKAATGDYIGWIHADMQMPPEKLCIFFNHILSHSPNNNFFLKGVRTNRTACDMFFTHGQSIVNSWMFKEKIYDVGAIPVIFHRSLLDYIDVDSMPNDFSIELYIYVMAVRHNYEVVRYKFKLLNREKGASSWSKSITSKVKQAKRIYSDSRHIKKGEKVL